MKMQPLDRCVAPNFSDRFNRNVHPCYWSILRAGISKSHSYLTLESRLLECALYRSDWIIMEEGKLSSIRWRWRLKSSLLLDQMPFSVTTLVMMVGCWPTETTYSKWRWRWNANRVAYRSNIATGGKVIWVQNVVRRAVGPGGPAGGQRGPRDDRRSGVWFTLLNSKSNIPKVTCKRSQRFEHHVCSWPSSAGLCPPPRSPPPTPPTK